MLLSELSHSQLTGMVMPEGIKNIEFTDEATAVNKAAKELKKKA